eukprot:4512975-Prymnesium_polylepis.1
MDLGLSELIAARCEARLDVPLHVCIGRRIRHLCDVRHVGRTLHSAKGGYARVRAVTHGGEAVHEALDEP